MKFLNDKLKTLFFSHKGLLIDEIFKKSYFTYFQLIKNSFETLYFLDRFVELILYLGSNMTQLSSMRMVVISYLDLHFGLFLCSSK